MSLASENPRHLEPLRWHGLPGTAPPPSRPAAQRSEVALVLSDVINDTRMRGCQLILPRDCVASETARDTADALEQMRRVPRADTRPAAELCATGSIVGLRPARRTRGGER